MFILLKTEPALFKKGFPLFDNDYPNLLIPPAATDLTQLPIPDFVIAPNIVGTDFANDHTVPIVEAIYGKF